MDWALDSDDVNFGDSGPWVARLPQAWTNASARPPLRVPARPAAPDGPADRETQIPYWAPLLHLLVYGLGWNVPAAGLDRWREAGLRAEDDPLLASVLDWWGPRHLLDFEAWLVSSHTARTLNDRLASERPALCPPAGTAHDSPPLETVRSTTSWKSLWDGEGDPMHLVDHTFGPLTRSTNQCERFVSISDNRRQLIDLGSYAGWYRELERLSDHSMTGASSTRVRVICQPVGSLGDFRRSRETGIWFRGRHSIHMWGN